MAYELVIANKNYSSWSLRSWVLMRMLGIDFVERFQQTLHWDNFEVYRRHSPSGKLPCLIDEGTRIWDSLAITSYLAERHEGIWPEDSAARAWAYSATAEMHSGLSASGCPFCVSARVELARLSEELKRDFERIDQLWCEGKDRFGGPFLAGAAFTAADAFFVPVAFRIQTYDLKLSSQSQAWVTTVLSLPAVREWEQEAHADPWRETNHEKEVLANGRLICDLRDQSAKGAAGWATGKPDRPNPARS